VWCRRDWEIPTDSEQTVYTPLIDTLIITRQGYHSPELVRYLCLSCPSELSSLSPGNTLEMPTYPSSGIILDDESRLAYRGETN
jgi:hypothetical protein